MGDEISQQRKLFRREFDGLAGTQDLIATDVDLDIAESINLGQRRPVAKRAAAQLSRGPSVHELRTVW